MKHLVITFNEVYAKNSHRLTRLSFYTVRQISR